MKGRSVAWLGRVGGARAAYAGSTLRRAVALLPRPALLLSLVSLAFSAISLYVTVLERPRLTIFAGCNWQYGRGPGSFDEYFVVPITIVNDGARGGTVLAFELLVDKDGLPGSPGAPRSFAGNFTLDGFNDQKRQLYAPLAIAGHGSASSAIVFTRRMRADSPLFNIAAPAAADRFQATLTFRAAAAADAFVDRLFSSPPAEARFEPALRADDLAPVLDDKLASFDACAPGRSNSAGGDSRQPMKQLMK